MYSLLIHEITYRHTFLQTNCLTEIFVERALARARELDRILKTTGRVAGPLHGLPISLKDQFQIEGLETTLGTSFFTEDSVTNCFGFTRTCVFDRKLFQRGCITRTDITRGRRCALREDKCSANTDGK